MGVRCTTWTKQLTTTCIQIVILSCFFPPPTPHTHSYSRSDSFFSSKSPFVSCIWYQVDILLQEKKEGEEKNEASAGLFLPRERRRRRKDWIRKYDKNPCFSLSKETTFIPRRVCVCVPSHPIPCHSPPHNCQWNRKGENCFYYHGCTFQLTRIWQLWIHKLGNFKVLWMCDLYILHVFKMWAN